MQPYFMPYIGYYQLIADVEVFIIYDNIEYTKKGWINRNRMLRNGQDVMFTLPLKSDSDSKDIRERELAESFNRTKLLNQIKSAYQRAPYFAQTIPLVEQIVRHEDANLFRFLHHSIIQTCEYLGITTEIMVSSDISVNHELKSQDKVLALCDAVGASTYVNAIGGRDLYSKKIFRDKMIDLKFISPKSFTYRQFDNLHIPWLSIIDVMMFNTAADTANHIHNGYDLI